MGTKDIKHSLSPFGGTPFFCTKFLIIIKYLKKFGKEIVTKMQLIHISYPSDHVPITENVVLLKSLFSR